MLSPLFALMALAQAPAVNDRCPVTGFRVDNPRIFRTVEVGGRAYRVFDRRAGLLLLRWPEGFLTADGTPLRAQGRACAAGGGPHLRAVPEEAP